MTTALANSKSKNECLESKREAKTAITETNCFRAYQKHRSAITPASHQFNLREQYCSNEENPIAELGATSAYSKDYTSCIFVPALKSIKLPDFLWNGTDAVTKFEKEWPTAPSVSGSQSRC